MTWNKAHRRCPKGVVPACHNSLDTVTVSGPADAVASFIAELQEEGVFATAVNTGGVAFHSHYVSPAAPALKERLQQVSPASILYNYRQRDQQQSGYVSINSQLILSDAN